MNNVPGVNFIGLEPEEVLSKVSLLAKNKETLKIWIKGGEPHLYRLSELQKLKIEGNLRLVLTLFSEGSDVDLNFLDKDVFLSFEIGEIDYFCEAKVTGTDDDGDVLVYLAGTMYRSENRISERLLTFPHHQVYAYFRLDQSAQNIDNVVQLNKNAEADYLNYKKAQKQKLLDELAKKIDDVEDLVGFRAIDISNSGIAFLVSKDEENFFSKGKKYDFIILFDGEIYNIKAAKIVYNIDFVGPRAGADSKYKIGLNFNPISELSSTIDSILKQSNALGKIQKDFENFVKE